MLPIKTTIDWLGYRTQAEVPAVLEAMRGMFGTHGDWLNLEYLPRGKDGFAQGAALRFADQVIGRLDYGGEQQRGWVRVNVTGTGCENVADWDAIEAVEALSSAQLRRTDIALTTWRNEVNHERVERAHGHGGFNGGGRPPTMQQIISSDPNAGRSICVGSRRGDKYFRGYEKGLQLYGKQGLPVAHDTTIEGHPIRGIYRCEVELKAKETVIPWELIERRDQYFTGCYPFLGELLPGLEADILMRRPERGPQLELQAAIRNVRTQYGATLYTALVCYGGDITRLMDEIVGKDHNKALLEAGVLNFEHV